MGQAITRSNKFKLEHPQCCYCAGVAAAATIDHVPSRQMFWGKHRPKGLEVPSCEPCNKYTAKHEQVAAMLGRVYPNGSNSSEKEEIAKIVHAVRIYAPEVFNEIAERNFGDNKKAEAGTLVADGKLMNMGGPHLANSVRIFSAKLGFALYYAECKKIVPSSGAVAVDWYTNFDFLEGKIPEQLLSLMSNSKTLKQGSWSVKDQFMYSMAVDEKAGQALFFSAFRKSFACSAFVITDKKSIEMPSSLRIFEPGSFV